MTVYLAPLPKVVKSRLNNITGDKDLDDLMDLHSVVDPRGDTYKDVNLHYPKSMKEAWRDDTQKKKDLRNGTYKKGYGHAEGTYNTWDRRPTAMQNFKTQPPTSRAPAADTFDAWGRRATTVQGRTQAPAPDPKLSEQEEDGGCSCSIM